MMKRKWQYILGQPISWDEGYFVPRYPRHIAQAFLAIDYDDRDPDENAPPVPYQQPIEQAIQQFAQRWEGLDEQAFQSALREGRGRDRLTAIFALGCNSALPDALDLLAPFLASENQLERCATACIFALRRDERALPVLEEYLLHEPPEDEEGRYLPASEVWYKSHRCRIASVLATWGPPSIVWVLRQACIGLWELEGETMGHIDDQSTQDALCYALGRRGALGAFHGIELSARRKRIAITYLALGYVRANEQFDDFTREILLNDTLKQELTMVLKEYFALSEEEGKIIIRSFPIDIERRRKIASYIEEVDTTSSLLENAVWCKLIYALEPTARFASPASETQLKELKVALGVALPEDLKAVLREANGVREYHGFCILWSIEEIVRYNQEMRTLPDYHQYKPFTDLLFFAETVVGDRFAFPILQGEVQQGPVFVWDHEDDTREVVASSLKSYLEGWLRREISV